MLPIPIFIGISERFKAIEGMTERSILEHTKSPVHITHLYPEVEAGCTGFTNARYTIKYGIYLDCDMILMADISELWEYKQEGKFVCMEDGASEVAVIDCDHLCTNKHEEKLLPKSKIIPSYWNIKDKLIPGMKLLHFCDMHTQPWISEHPDELATALYRRYI